MNSIEANQLIHGSLASTGEYDKSPHFFPENQCFVKNLIFDFLKSNSLTVDSVFNNWLDIGCGTGFLYQTLENIGFGSYIGVDITDQMMDVFKQKYPSVNLINCKAESMPFSSNKFSVITNYSFLDHVEDLNVLFKEVFRVLDDNGLFYSGLIPNSAFAKVIENAYSSDLNFHWFSSSDSMNKEYKSMFENGSIYNQKYGFSEDALLAAEPQKTKYHGISPEVITNNLLKIGFKDVIICPNWYFSQSQEKINQNAMNIIDAYLKKHGPVTFSLFKYFDFFAIK